MDGWCRHDGIGPMRGWHVSGLGHFSAEAVPEQADPLLQDGPGMAALLARSVSRRIAFCLNAG